MRETQVYARSGSLTVFAKERESLCFAALAVAGVQRKRARAFVASLQEACVFFFARAGRRNFSSDGISLLVYFDCSAGGVSSEVVDSLVLKQVFPVINELLVLLLLLHLC